MPLTNVLDDSMVQQMRDIEHLENRISKIQEMRAAGATLAEIDRFQNEDIFALALERASVDEPRLFGAPESAFYTLVSHYRREMALAYCEEWGTEWASLAEDWCSWDAIHRDAWKRLFKRDRHLWSVDIFSDEQRGFYDSLPEQITIFRGCNTAIRNGHRHLSWTLDIEIARDFSKKGIRGFQAGGSPVIYQGTIAKRNVALAIDDRSEKEIVPFSIRSVRNICRI